MDIKNLSLDERAQCAAYLRATHNMSQTEIGYVMGGLSQPHVSRLLTHAEKRNYLIIEQRFASELFSQDWIQRIDELLAPSGLSGTLDAYCKAAGVPTPRVRVFESGLGRNDAAVEQRRARFGRSAAGRVIELIENAQIIGIAWGKTLHAVVAGIKSSRQPVRTSNRREFAAVCAELVSHWQSGYSSSWLANELDEIFNATRGDFPQLTSFPAYIPKRYNPKMRQAIRHYIHDIPGYNRVFVGPDALVDRMDMLISGVGSSNMPILGTFEELVVASGIEANELRKLVVGDLGGILIPKTGLSDDQQKLIEELNEMWTGIKSEQVQAISQRAFADPSRSGVVVVALQSERGDTVFELVRRGLINELILDQTAAAQLFRRLTERKPH